MVAAVAATMMMKLCCHNICCRKKQNKKETKATTTSSKRRRGTTTKSIEETDRPDYPVKRRRKSSKLENSPLCELLISFYKNEVEEEGAAAAFFLWPANDPCYTSYSGLKATNIAGSGTTSVAKNKKAAIAPPRTSSRVKGRVATAVQSRKNANIILYKDYSHFARIGVSDINRCDSVITSVQSLDEYEELVNHMRSQVNSKGVFLDTKDFSHFVIWKNVPEKKSFAAAGYLAHFTKDKYQVLSQIAVIPHFRRMGLAMRLYKHFNVIFNRNAELTAQGTNLAVEDPEPECSSLLCKAEGDNLDYVIACYDRNVFYRLSSWISEFYEEEFDEEGQPTQSFRYLNNDEELEHQKQLAIGAAAAKGTVPSIPTTVVRSYYKKRIHCWFITENLDYVMCRVARSELGDGGRKKKGTKKQKNSEDEVVLSPRPFIFGSVALEKFNTYNLMDSVALYFTKKHFSTMNPPTCIKRMYHCPETKTFVDIYALLLDGTSLKNLKLNKKESSLMVIKKIPVSPSTSTIE